MINKWKRLNALLARSTRAVLNRLFVSQQEISTTLAALISGSNAIANVLNQVDRNIQSLITDGSASANVLNRVDLNVQIVISGSIASANVLNRVDLNLQSLIAEADRLRAQMELRDRLELMHRRAIFRRMTEIERHRYGQPKPGPIPLPVKNQMRTSLD